MGNLTSRISFRNGGCGETLVDFRTLEDMHALLHAKNMTFGPKKCSQHVLPGVRSGW